MNISIISACNNNCEYCFQHGYHQENKMLTFEEIEDASLKERIIKYARYIGSSNESIYIARIDAIYTFQTA